MSSQTCCTVPQHSRRGYSVRLSEASSSPIPRPPAPGPQQVALAYQEVHKRPAALQGGAWKVWLVLGDCTLIGLSPVLVHLAKDAQGQYQFSPISVNLLVEAMKTLFALGTLLAYVSGAAVCGRMDGWRGRGGEASSTRPPPVAVNPLSLRCRRRHRCCCRARGGRACRCIAAGRRLRGTRGTTACCSSRPRSTRSTTRSSLRCSSSSSPPPPRCFPTSRSVPSSGWDGRSVGWGGRLFRSFGVGRPGQGKEGARSVERGALFVGRFQMASRSSPHLAPAPHSTPPQLQPPPPALRYADPGDRGADAVGHAPHL